MSSEPVLGLFEGVGIELEYMIVDAQSLDVKPIADRLLFEEGGVRENEIERDGFAWSNELALHVIEMKTNGPAPGCAGLAAGFAGEVARMNARLAGHGARLLPSGMHPWMAPDREFEIWPHGNRSIYEAFHRIFDCTGHGWANLQSAHLNLPFADDEEFGRLHAAARALLPLLPALSASSPYREGRHPGTLDTRLDVYRQNARRVPSVAGAVVPEPVFTRREYEALLEKIYADLAPHDREGVLRHEWVNSRGAIARFDRMAIEIRVLDVQECPQADLAIAAFVSRVLARLCGSERAVQARLRALGTDALAAILRETIAKGERARIGDRSYLEALGLGGSPRSAGELWRELLERHVVEEASLAEHLPALEILIEEGPLARRLLERLGPEPATVDLHAAYHELAECLAAGRLFRAAG